MSLNNFLAFVTINTACKSFRVYYSLLFLVLFHAGNRVYSQVPHKNTSVAVKHNEGSTEVNLKNDSGSMLASFELRIKPVGTIVTENEKTPEILSNDRKDIILFNYRPEVHWWCTCAYWATSDHSFASDVNFGKTAFEILKIKGLVKDKELLDGVHCIAIKGRTASFLITDYRIKPSYDTIAFKLQLDLDGRWRYVDNSFTSLKVK